MLGFLTLGIDVQMEIIYQLECGPLGIQGKHLLDEVDHIPIGSTSETMKPCIDLHAGMFIIMKRAASHSDPPDL